MNAITFRREDLTEKSNLRRESLQTREKESHPPVSQDWTPAGTPVVQDHWNCMDLRRIEKTQQANQQRTTQITAGLLQPTQAPMRPILQLQRTIGNRAVQRLLYSGETRPALFGPVWIMRGRFDGEDPAHRIRRLAVINLARGAAERLRNALSRGYIWTYFERVTSGGVTARHIGVEETVAEREERLRQVIADLIGLVRELEAAPILTAWLAPIVRDSSGSLDVSSFDPTWTDTVRFYAHRGVAIGRGTELLYFNIPYIEREPTPARTVARAPISRGVNLGIYISVPDPENEPLIYSRVTGYEPLPTRGVILDVWHDDFGYYYLFKGERHYLPGRP